MVEVIRPGRIENLIINPDDSSVHTMELMGNDYITIRFTSQSKVDLQIGDYIIFNGRQFFLNRPPEPSIKRMNEFVYSCEFEASSYELLNVILTSPITGRSDFFFTGTAEDFVDLVLLAINEDYPGWQKGDIVVTDRKNLYFENDSCRAVLNKVAEEFDIEFVLNRTDRTIDFFERYENTRPITLEMGVNSPLYTIKRQNADDHSTITRIRAFGGEKNIPPDYRNGENRLIFINPATGKNTVEDFSISSKVYERAVIFEDIYPKFEGEITGVTADNKTITVPGIDFDINNYMLQGVAPKVIFLTGDLMNREFEFSYDHATRQITISPIEESGIIYPSDSFKPAVGDVITLVDILMPQSYVDAAEAKLLNAAQNYFNNRKYERVKYTVTFNPVYFEQNPSYADIKPGDVLTLRDSKVDADLSIRVISVSRKVNSPYEITAEISNITQQNEIEVLKATIARTSSETVKSNIYTSGGGDATKSWVTSNFAQLNGENTFTQDQTINGDLNVSEAVSGEYLLNKSDFIEVRSGNEDALAQSIAGVKIKNFDGVNDFLIGVDAEGVFKVGMEGNLGSLFTMADTMNDRGALFWNNSAHRIENNDKVQIGSLGLGVNKYPQIALDIGFIYADDIKFIRVQDGSNEYSLAKINYGSSSSAFGVGIDAQVNSGSYPAFSIKAHRKNNGSINTPVQQFESTVEGTIADGQLLFRFSKGAYGTEDGNSLVDIYGDGSVHFIGNLKNRGTFVSGFAGSGWQLDTSTNHLTIDSLTVRKDMNIYEMYISKIRATNGSFWVNDSAKVVEVTEDASYYYLHFDDDNGANPHPFQPHDIIKSQKFTGRDVRVVVGRVTSLENLITSSVVPLIKAQTTGIPEAGDEFVSIGNYSNPDRQGSIYLTSSDYGAPFVDVLDGVNSPDLCGKTKVRLGYLPGISDPDFGGQLDGYGLYAENAYLKGKIVVTGGNAATTDYADSVAETAKNEAIDAINTGEIYLRGTGLNRNAARVLLLSGNVVYNSSSGRGLRLVTINRTDLSVVDNILYDVYGDASARQALADKLNSLDDSVIVTLSSYDAIATTPALQQAMERCGGSGTYFGGSFHRVPYVLIGIPGIGEGNGIEVFTSPDPDAPFAEISTKIINGTPQGINVTGSKLLAKFEDTIIEGGYIKSSLLDINTIISSNNIATTGQLQSQINDALASYDATLGTLAHLNSVGTSNLNSTIISGGYIRSSLLDVQAIKVSGSFVSQSEAESLMNDAVSDANSYTDGKTNAVLNSAEGIISDTKRDLLKTAPLVFSWSGNLYIDVNTNYASATDKWFFNSAKACTGLIRITGTDFEGGARLYFNGVFIGTMSGADNATKTYDFEVDIVEGDNEICVFSTTSDAGYLKEIAVHGLTNQTYITGDGIYTGGLYSNIGVLGGWTIEESIYYGDNDNITSEGFAETSGLVLKSGAIYGKKLRITSDGSIVATEATLSGTIDANSGNIGGFVISESGLSRTVTGYGGISLISPADGREASINIFNAGGSPFIAFKSGEIDSISNVTSSLLFLQGTSNSDSSYHSVAPLYGLTKNYYSNYSGGTIYIGSSYGGSITSAITNLSYNVLYELNTSVTVGVSFDAAPATEETSVFYNGVPYKKIKTLTISSVQGSATGTVNFLIENSSGSEVYYNKSESFSFTPSYNNIVNGTILSKSLFFTGPVTFKSAFRFKVELYCQNSVVLNYSIKYKKWDMSVGDWVDTVAPPGAPTSETTFGTVSARALVGSFRGSSSAGAIQIGSNGLQAVFSATKYFRVNDDDPTLVTIRGDVDLIGDLDAQDISCYNIDATNGDFSKLTFGYLSRYSTTVSSGSTRSIDISDYNVLSIYPYGTCYIQFTGSASSGKVLIVFNRNDGAPLYLQNVVRNVTNFRVDGGESVILLRDSVYWYPLSMYDHNW